MIWSGPLPTQSSPFVADRKQVAWWKHAKKEAEGQKEKGGGEYSILEDLYLRHQVQKSYPEG